MGKYTNALPQLSGGTFLQYTGMETDLIFNRGIELPGFAAYVLLENAEGRAVLMAYCRDLIRCGAEHGGGVILDSATWVANRDRGAAIGYSPAALARLNRAAVALIAEARDEEGDLPTVLSGQLGPRGDAYAPDRQMSADEAQDYHAEQIGALAETEVDLISAFTLAYPNEAIGIVRACRDAGLPAAVAFTVETDGRLPTGMPLGEAIVAVDDATDGAAAYYLVNCAHPDHLALEHAPWADRLRGVVANASRRSHAELDEATELDAGDPEELGAQTAEIARAFAHFTVFGGCCGTDMRHLTQIARRTVAA